MQFLARFNVVGNIALVFHRARNKLKLELEICHDVKQLDRHLPNITQQSKF